MSHFDAQGRRMVGILGILGSRTRKSCLLSRYIRIYEKRLASFHFHPTFSSDARGVAEPSTDVSVAQSMLVVVVVC